MVLGSQVAVRLGVACAALLGTAAAVRWLWLFWTPRCTETCEPAIAMSMYGLILGSVGITLALALPVAIGKLSPKKAAGAYMVVAAGVVAIAATLTALI